MSGVCPSVCLRQTTKRIFTKILTQMRLHKEERIKFWTSSASGSGSRNFLKDSSILRDRAFSHIWLYNIYGESDRIFIYVLSQMYPWTRKSSLNYRSNLDAELRCRLCIQTRIFLAEVCALYSCCTCF